MKNQTMKYALSAVGLSLAMGSLSVAADAINETLIKGDVVRSHTVAYNRYEMNTAEGREDVVKRLEEAAEDVCGSVSYPHPGGLSGIKESRECREKAVAQAIQQIDAAQIATR